MPHLDAVAGNDGKGASTGSESERDAKDAQKNDRGAISLLTLASTVRDHEASAEGGKQPATAKHVVGDGVTGVVGSYHAVTPSPFGRGMSFQVHPTHPMFGERPSMPPDGPMGMGAPANGARRLFPSPIRLDSTKKQNGSKTTQKSKGKTSPAKSPSKSSVKSPTGKGGKAEGRTKQDSGHPHDLPPPLRSPPYNYPYHLGYHGGPPAFPVYHGYTYHQEYVGPATLHYKNSPSRKTDVDKKKIKGFSPIKSRIQMEKESDTNNGSIAKRPAASSIFEDEVVQGGETETSEDEKKPQSKKQRVISPSSSLEASQQSGKGEDDDSTEEKASDASLYPPPVLSRTSLPPPFYPHDPRYQYPPPLYEGSAPMHGWHHPHNFPMYPMPPGPNGFMHPPPPGTPQHYPVGSPLQYQYMHPNEAPYSALSTPERDGGTINSVPLSRTKATTGNNRTTTRTPTKDTGGERKIKSVAEWQRVAMETGLAPSANRCVPLKGPIPSKYWGEEEKKSESTIPEFHHLVNFPDYMAKNLSTPNGSAFSQDGKKHCVMCGKERLSSASAMMSRPRSSAKSRVNKDFDEPNDGAIHIIPKQNKGLCTACDVRVWVICESALEIKWCKGCKNFRPWAAFGNKGLATKCVRCRERQREKYATQKSELKKQRGLANEIERKKINTEKKSRLTYAYDEEKKVSDDGEDVKEAVAARGLRNLLAASAEMHQNI